MRLLSTYSCHSNSCNIRIELNCERMIEIAETDMRTLKNNTAQRLSLLDTTKSRVALQIAPFGEEILSTDDLDMLNLQPSIARGNVTVEVTPPVDYAMAKNAFYFPIGIAVWGLIIFGIWHLFGTVPANYWSWVLGIIGVSALGVISDGIRLMHSCWRQFVFSAAARRRCAARVAGAGSGRSSSSKS